MIINNRQWNDVTIKALIRACLHHRDPSTGKVQVWDAYNMNRDFWRSRNISRGGFKNMVNRVRRAQGNKLPASEFDHRASWYHQLVQLIRQSFPHMKVNDGLFMRVRENDRQAGGDVKKPCSHDRVDGNGEVLFEMDMGNKEVRKAKIRDFLVENGFKMHPGGRFTYEDGPFEIAFATGKFAAMFGVDAIRVYTHQSDVPFKTEYLYGAHVLEGCGFSSNELGKKMTMCIEANNFMGKMVA